MTADVLLAAALGGVVGIALGLTGGGGSIFAVPLLIYGLGLAPIEAVAMSLVAVAVTAFVGALQSLRHGLVVWQPVVLFSLGGIVGAPAGVMVARWIDADLIVAAFAVLAIVVGTLMWHASRRRPEQAAAVRARPYEAGGGAICVLAPDGQLRFTAPCAFALAIVGIGTGLLSGLFGVGGGFLIVPALVLVTRMGVHRAVASSLAIITAIGFAGSSSAIWQGRIDWLVLAPFAAGGALAMLGARAFAARIAGPVLQRVFAASIVAVGIAMLVERLM
ncbi:MAG: sulfite exporter TauE/SafE family protein [Gammaproteobacteria bacterium]|nr:sulfite exporter TauE/SafE family protein [Gammaproteobacteria bacterium]